MYKEDGSALKSHDDRHQPFLPTNIPDTKIEP